MNRIKFPVRFTAMREAVWGSGFITLEAEMLRNAISLHRARTLQERGLCRAADGNLWGVLSAVEKD